MISRLELGVAVVFVGATVHGRAGDNSMGASESTALDVGKDAVFIPWKDGQSSAVAPQPTKKPAKQPALGGLVLDEKARSKVRSILDEVIATERTYVTALGTLNEKFLPLIRTELDGECLACLGTLLSIHRELLTSLEDALSQRERLEEAAAEEAESAPPEQPSMLVEMHLWSVARAFTMMAPFLKTYSTYCRGYTRAIAQLPAVFRAVPQLATLQAENGNEGLDSLLIRLVQRLCKYPLFRRDLPRPRRRRRRRRRRRPAAGGAGGGERALERVNGEVNAQSARAAEGQRLVALHHALGGALPALLAPTRALLVDVDLRVTATRRPTRSSRGAIVDAGGAALGAIVGAATRGRRHKLVLLDDAILLARHRRAHRRARAPLLPRQPRRQRRASAGGGVSGLVGDAQIEGRARSRERHHHAFGLTRAVAAVADCDQGAPRPPPTCRRPRRLRRRRGRRRARWSVKSTAPPIEYACRCSDAAAAAALSTPSPARASVWRRRARGASGERRWPTSAALSSSTATTRTAGRRPRARPSPMRRTEQESRF